MPTEQRPPVNEVVVSVALQRNDALTGPMLGSVLGSDLLAEYPTVEPQPPYQMPVELPPQSGALRGSLPQPQFTFSTQTPDQRYWLISADNVHLLQFQPDYFAYNWRRQDAEQSYPGFDRLSPRFWETLDAVSDRLEGQGKGTIVPTHAELTYINIISPEDGIWSSHSDMRNALTLSFPEINSTEQFILNYSKVLTLHDGSFQGRAHVSVQPAIDLTTGGPLINLTITVRSAPLEGGDPRTLTEQFMTDAHRAVIDSFRSLTTAAAHEAWRIFQ